MTSESFVTFTMMIDNHPEVPEPLKKDLTIQLFDHFCPKTCKRFKDLCEGITHDGVVASYKHNLCNRVSKDSFVQFGNLLLINSTSGIDT